MRVLVLGAYGMIGEAIADRLSADGHDVTGLGRNIARARRRKPHLRWLEADISRLTSPDKWTPLLEGADAVVNAAGALQDSFRDNVSAVHETAIIALMRACEMNGVRRFVQISAVGADRESAPRFFRTKAVADAALARSSLDWTILRPGLVISPVPYGSTALLRGLAALPVFQPVVLADRPIQTVSVEDVAASVSASLAGRLPSRVAVDLVEDASHSVRAVVTAFRRHLGLSPARILPLPAIMGLPFSALADLLGWLGWRSPLRSTAMRAISDGVTGDAEPYRALAGKSLSSLDQTLAALPGGVQESWFARLYLLKPVIIGTLALFWIASGMIGLARADAAGAVLTARGMAGDLAQIAVLAGSLVDIALGLAVLVRRAARTALVGMLVVTLVYIAGGSLVAPDLWLDPLGPLVKTIPAAVLALAGLAVLDDR